jgi:hypothetical protein
LETYLEEISPPSVPNDMPQNLAISARLWHFVRRLSGCRLVYTGAINGRMSHSKNSALRSGESRFVIGVSVLLLAFAVFGWGLHSKLSLYHIGARASETAPIAKLLSERERPADAAQRCYTDHGDLFVTSPPVSILLMPSFDDGIRAKQPREDAPQPLPSRSVTYKGPSLRRPPPSLVA